jgi:hypothetical protein
VNGAGGDAPSETEAPPVVAVPSQAAGAGNNRTLYLCTREGFMDIDRKAFTVPFPEARKIRTANTLWLVFFFLVWILWGVGLFGPPEIPNWALLTVMAIAFALSIGFSIYGTRKQKELAPVINHRFAEEFTAHTSDEFPQDVDILKVKRSVAVRRDDGSVLLWGVKRSKDAFNVFPMT